MSALSQAEPVSIGPDALPAAPWRQDIGLAPSVPYGAATELLRQGSPVRHVFFIESGVVKLTYLSPEGREIIANLRYPGWFLGAAAAIVGQQSPLTAATLTRSDLRPIPVQHFLQRVRSDPSLSWYLHQITSREVCEQTVRLAQVACFSAGERLKQFLWQLACGLRQTPPPGSVRVCSPLKHHEIAQLIAVTPEHLSRLLRRLQQEGIVRLEKGWLVIADARLLRLSAVRLESRAQQLMEINVDLDPDQ